MFKGYWGDPEHHLDKSSRKVLNAFVRTLDESIFVNLFDSHRDILLVSTQDIRQVYFTI
ncbi:uncharacterized protein PHALS_11442 [Plasmopara halstedii]|uniref:Uncharacterized protein n=1 Tax=Plasmopara halstedii TaxID=4781 RepID=A0A0P1A5D2_PLAHL|nr:uncharacterized protein PHALS_11442 [Plasmopara halstedii]CEG35568.1 hypothetical protein PHALS_11442 [Plasmopara halstedii]|eukprot:XP_024571937.1 hypothetical protein PHALS_11442 [Plasmopara halstedii]